MDIIVQAGDAATDRTPAVQEEETITADRISPCYQRTQTPLALIASQCLYFLCRAVVLCSVPVPVPRNGTTTQ